MKTILSSAILSLAFLSSSASAGVLEDIFSGNFPAHEQNGYRDTGCVEEMFTDILNKDGEVLYQNNPSCGGFMGNGGPNTNLGKPPAGVGGQPPKGCEDKPKDRPDDKDHGKGHGKDHGKGH